MITVLTERLKSLCKANNLSQRAVATAAGMDQRAYGRYEIGARVPRPEQLVALADLRGASLDYLAGREERTEQPAEYTPPSNSPLNCIYFRTYLTHLHKHMGLTHKQLADATGCSEIAVARYETGEAVPFVHPAIELARALNTTVGYLLGTVDGPNPHLFGGKLSMADISPAKAKSKDPTGNPDGDS